MMPTNYEIPCSFSEKQIEADVSNYFGFLSPLCGRRLKLLDVNETATGADKKFYSHGVAYFFQFKKPTGLVSTSEVPIPATPRRNESPLQGIRRYREKQGLDQEPYTACFQLRKRANPHARLQHNVLFSYEKLPASRALYVCPTVLDYEEYEALLTIPFWHRFRESLMSFRDYRLHISDRLVPSLIASVPFLRGHVSIVPHAQVTTSDHYYSFSRHGTDIAFHSPETLESGPNRLSDFLASEFRRIMSYPDRILPLPHLVKSIYEISRGWAGQELVSPLDREPLDWLKQHGQFLREKFGIRQVISLIDHDWLKQNRD